MEKYESKHVRILRPAETVYGVLSRFDNLTPVLADKVEGWTADENTCSFKAKGFPVRLRMVEKEPFKLVKVTGEDAAPVTVTQCPSPSSAVSTIGSPKRSAARKRTGTSRISSFS